MQPSAIEDIRSQLDPDERVLWSGRPNERAYMLQGSLLLIPFTLMWLAFSIFWEVSVIASHAPWFFLLWGVPFVALGIYIAFGRFWVARREARNSTYAVTDQRIMINTGAFNRRFTEIPLDGTASLSVDHGRGHLGTISFANSSWPFSFAAAGWPMMSRMRPPQFVAIDNVDKVFRIIQDARREFRARRQAPS